MTFIHFVTGKSHLAGGEKHIPSPKLPHFWWIFPKKRNIDRLGESKGKISGG
jgi:hypothetical protein